MNKILPYPWQHPTYDEQEFTGLIGRVKFCIERSEEALKSGLYNVERAWKAEMCKFIPQLVEEYEQVLNILEEAHERTA